MGGGSRNDLLRKRRFPRQQIPIKIANYHDSGQSAEVHFYGRRSRMVRRTATSKKIYLIEAKENYIYMRVRYGKPIKAKSLLGNQFSSLTGDSFSTATTVIMFQNQHYYYSWKWGSFKYNFI